MLGAKGILVVVNSEYFNSASQHYKAAHEQEEDEDLIMEFSLH